MQSRARRRISLRIVDRSIKTKEQEEDIARSSSIALVMTKQIRHDYLSAKREANTVHYSRMFRRISRLRSQD